MKQLFFLLAIILAGCNHSKSTSVSVGDPSDSIRSNSNSYLSKLAALKQFNGVVLLKKGGDVILKKAYNISNDSNSTLHVSTNSQFDLRSVAKLFAKASVLQLQRNGNINLQDPLKTYIRDFPQGDRITIGQLVSHSSGLPRELSENSLRPIDMTPEDVIRLAAREPLEFEPGSQSQYSNVGYQLLYYIIGLQAESTFVEYLRERYFSPLKMNNTGSNFDDPIDVKKNYAFGHFVRGDTIVCECTPPEDEMRMGNLFSTVEDLDAFLTSFDSLKNKELMVEGKISHAGGTRGKRAYVERDFEEDYTIIFLANYDEIPFEKLVKDLQSLLMGQEVSMPKEINRIPTQVEPSILKKYTGTYDIAEAGHLTLTIKLEKDSLFLYQKGQNNGVLYPESEAVFFGDPTSEESIEFVQDSIGDYYMLLDFQGVQWKGIRISK